MSDETPLSNTTVFSARPQVRVDGEQTDKVRELLLSVVVRLQEGGLASAEVKFSNIASKEDGSANFAFEDGDVLAHGKQITIEMGDAEQPTQVFKGKVSGLEAEFGEETPPELVLFAEDALFAARLARRSAVYTDATVADVVNQVANRLGLSPDVSGLSEQLGTVVQLNESDLAFLRRVLDPFDADLWVDDTTLRVTPRGSRSGDEVTVNLSSQLRSVRFFADLAHQVTTVTTAGFDVTQGQAVQGSVSNRSPGPGSGRSGATVLSDTLGDRAEHVSDLRVATHGEAQALAEAAFDQRARRFVVAEGTLAGNPAVKVGTRLVLQGVGPRFENTYEVVAATHRYDLESGYQTDFRAQSAFLGGR